MKEFIGEYPCYILTPMRYGIIDMVYVQSFFLAMYRYMICLHGKKINCLGQHAWAKVFSAMTFVIPFGCLFLNSWKAKNYPSILTCLGEEKNTSQLQSLWF